MKEGRTAKVQLMAEPSLIARIDDWRFEHRVGSRSMAMRQLIGNALDKKEGPAEAATSPSQDQSQSC